MRHNEMKALTVETVADIFSLKPRTIARWCREGKIEGAFKLGRVWRIPYDSTTLHRRVVQHGSKPE